MCDGKCGGFQKCRISIPNKLQATVTRKRKLLVQPNKIINYTLDDTYKMIEQKYNSTIYFQLNIFDLWISQTSENTKCKYYCLTFIVNCQFQTPRYNNKWWQMQVDKWYNTPKQNILKIIITIHLSVTHFHKLFSHDHKYTKILHNSDTSISQKCCGNIPTFRIDDRSSFHKLLQTDL